MAPNSSIAKHIGINLAQIRNRIACLSCVSSSMTPRLRDTRRNPERSISTIIGGNNSASADSTDEILMPVMVASSGKSVLKWFPVQRKARGPEATWAARTVELKMAQDQTDGTEDLKTSQSPTTVSSHTKSTLSTYSGDAGSSDSGSEYMYDNDEDDGGEGGDDADSLIEVIWDSDFMAGLRSWPYILPTEAQSGGFLPYSPRQFLSGSDSHLDPEMFGDTPASLVSDIVLEEFDDETEWDSEYDSEEEEEEEGKKGGKSRSLWQKIKKFFTRR